MTRRLLVVIAAALALVLAACGSGVEETGGGGGGDATVATTADTKPDTTATTTTDTTAGGGGNEDIPPGQDPRDILGDDPALNELANQCFDGDMGACDDLFAQTPVDSDLEAYSQTCGGRIDEVDGPPNCVARFDAGDPVEPDDFDSAEFNRLAQQCFDGDFGACDDLFIQTPVGSAAEDYGSTCGGRLTDGVSGSCEDLLGSDTSVN